MGRTALSTAPNRQTSETTPDVGPSAGGAALRLAPPAPGSSGGGVPNFLRFGAAEGHLARWACWDRRPLGLDFEPRAHVDQTPK
eukprot:4042089-Alexandrium_andersonii.AAC.1